MKRAVLIGALALLTAAVAAVVFLQFAPGPIAEAPPPSTTPTPPPPPVATPTPPEIVLPELPGHDDLKLVPDAPGPFRVYPGVTPNVALKLVNTSPTRSHPVVKPGDGSEVGWCEPYTFLSATLTRPTGETVKLTREQYGRCGLFDADWTKRVVTLKPGESIPVSWPDLVPFDFQEEGTVAMRVHYRYAGLEPHKDVTKAEPAADLGGMKGVPPFEVVSDPIRVEVVRPFDLKLTLKQPTVKVGEWFTLPDLLTAELTRLKKDPVQDPKAQGKLILHAEEKFGYGAWVFEGEACHSINEYLPVQNPNVGESVELFASLNPKSEQVQKWHRPSRARRGGSLILQLEYVGTDCGKLKSNPVELTITP